MEKSHIDDYTEAYPDIPKMIIHQNGGGRICTRSKVALDSCVGSKVTILRSVVNRGSHLEGHFLIEDSRVHKTITTETNLDQIAPSEIRKSHVTHSKFSGDITINHGFIVTAEIDGDEAPVGIKFFHVGHSYLKGKINLEGLPKELEGTPFRNNPSLLGSHIEGEISLVLPYKTCVHSIIIKPRDVSLKAQPNRIELERRLKALPPEDKTEIEVVWAYEADQKLADELLK